MLGRLPPHGFLNIDQQHPGSGLRSFKGPVLVALATMILLLLAVYWQGLSGPFLLDDNDNIGPAKVSSWSWDELKSVVSANSSGPLGRPVSVLSFTLNHALGGSTPFGFKLVNLVLHTVCGVLLFWLGGRLLGDLFPSSVSPARVWMVAAITALIWAMHPIQVSTVLYAVQRMAILASLFSVAACICYIDLRRSLTSGGGIAWRCVLLAALMLLSVLSKESGMLVVFYLLTIELVVYRFRVADQSARRKLGMILVCYCVLPLVAGVIFFIFRAESWMAAYQLRDHTMLERLLTEPGVLWFYLKLMLAPDVTQMGIFHDDYPIATLNAVTMVQIASVLLAAAAAVAMIATNKLPLVALGICWFLSSHLMESTFLPLELVFEHRNYLALWGLLLPLVFYLIPDAYRDSRSMLRTGAAVVIVALLTLQTFTRTTTWANPALWVATMAAEHPRSARARDTYASMLTDLGDFERALIEARAAEQNDALYSAYALSVLLLECRVGGVTAQTVERTRHKLAALPLTPYAIKRLKGILTAALQGNCPGLDASVLLTLSQAIADYATQEVDAGHKAAGLMFRGVVQSVFQETRPASLETFRAAYAADPSNLSALVELYRTQVTLGEIDAARETLALMKDHASTDSDRLSAEMERLLPVQ